MGIVDYTNPVLPTDKDQSLTLQTPEEKASNVAVSKAINTDWFAADISPTNSPAIMRIMIRLATTSVVSIYLDDGATTDLQLDLNGGVALTANSVYIFDILVLSGQSFNIQHATGTQNTFCSIAEISRFA